MTTLRNGIAWTKLVAVARPELVPAFWRNYQLTFGDNPAERLQAAEWLWAYEEVDDAAAEASPGVVELLVSLADAAPDDDAVAYLGAGPVEDLIRLHGQELVEEIDEAARRNERFRLALRSVWYDTATDPSLVTRLRRFGPPP